MSVLLLVVQVNMKLMDMHVRARAKSTCLVCKRTRDDHHIEMCMVIVTYLCMRGVGR